MNREIIPSHSALAIGLLCKGLKVDPAQLTSTQLWGMEMVAGCVCVCVSLIPFSLILTSVGDLFLCDFFGEE